METNNNLFTLLDCEYEKINKSSVNLVEMLTIDIDDDIKVTQLDTVKCLEKKLIEDIDNSYSNKENLLNTQTDEFNRKINNLSNNIILGIF